LLPAAAAAAAASANVWPPLRLLRRLLGSVIGSL
jgi:hypothetical protein